VDWYPTLKKLVGETSPPVNPLDGRDIWPTLTEGKPSPHEAILLNVTPSGGAVRKGDWKLVVKNGEDDPDNGAARKKANARSVELFDLKADPYEQTNLSEKEPARLAELKEVLARYAAQAVPPRNRPKAPGFVSPKVWGEAD
jgi:arylsulfatase A-like enzyme